MRVLIGDVPERGRYEATVDGELAGFLEYRVKRERTALIHTEVLPAFEGRGVASQIVRWALDDARRRGRRVLAICPYVRAYLERHPEERDVVVDGRPSGPSDGQVPTSPADEAPE